MGLHKYVVSLLLAAALFLSLTSISYADALAIRMDGMYCNLCTGGTITQLRNVPGVTSVRVWMANGIVWVTPANANLAALRKIIVNSTYPYRGAWVCPSMTSNLKACKRVG